MHTFSLFDLSHICALAATILAAMAMVYLMRSDTSEYYKSTARYTLGALLILAVILDPVLTLYRWGFTEFGKEILLNSTLPLYLCDVVSIVAAIALFTKNKYLAEITYLWGLAGTTQGLITPTLCYGWETPEYYNFFLQHGGVPIAAITLVWGLGITPQKGAFKRAILWSWVYMAVVISINFAIGQNYGFLNGKPGFQTLFDYMGPYPYYLITLQVVAFAFYWVLLKIAPKQDKEMNRIREIA